MSLLSAVRGLSDVKILTSTGSMLMWVYRDSANDADLILKGSPELWYSYRSRRCNSFRGSQRDKEVISPHGIFGREDSRPSQSIF